jgi:xylan 1,4-beta-xylosidase
LPLEQVVAESVVGAPDVNAVATRNGGEVDVLLWNYHDADLEAAPAAIRLGVDGLRGKAAVAAEFRMDGTHSDAYRAWQQMGSPAHPSAEQIAALQKAGGLEQTMPNHRIAIHAGKAEMNLTLPRQAVVLMRLVEH